MATEAFITKQIAGLKKSADGKTPSSSEKKEPGAIESLLQGIFNKDLVESIKGLVTGAVSLKGLVALGLALASRPLTGADTGTTAAVTVLQEVPVSVISHSRSP